MISAGKIQIPKGWQRADVLMASLTINLLALGLPMVILQMYDRIIPNASITTLGFLVIGLCGVTMTEILLRIIRSSIINAVGSRFEHQANVGAFDKLLTADLMHFQKESTAAYIDNMQSLNSVREFHLGQATLAAIDLPFVLIFLLLIWLIGGALVLIPLTLLALLIVSTAYIGQQLRGALDQRNVMDNRRYNFLIEVLAGIHTVKSMAMEPLMLRRYERLQAQSAEGVYELSRINSAGQGVGSTFSQAAIICLVGVGCLSVVDHSLTMGGLAACTMLSGRVLQPVLRATSIWNRFQSVALDEQKFTSLFELPQETRPNIRVAPQIKGGIRFENVALDFGDSGPSLFKDMSLTVEPGEMIGITGDNMSGKTSVLHLILGTLRPTEGRVLIDGHNLAELDPQIVRMQMGYIPQNGRFFNGTLLDNLTMFQEGDTKIQAMKMLNEVGLADFIARLPNGLDTKLGDAAAQGFPAGIEQRIVFARGLVTDPQIVLFDNANAGMDMQGDQSLMRIFERMKGKKTIIVVSHRPSLLRMCDRIYEISDQQLRLKKVPQTERKSGANTATPVPATKETQQPIGKIA